MINFIHCLRLVPTGMISFLSQKRENSQNKETSIELDVDIISRYGLI